MSEREYDERPWGKYQALERQATVMLEDPDHVVGPGHAIDISRDSAHRVVNRGDATLEFIQVQVGDYFGEDDIERLEDDYGRDS